MQLPSIYIEDLVRAALKEDLGRGLDITSQSVIDPSETVKATLQARQEGVLAGIIPALSAFSFIDSDIGYDVLAHDGEVLDAGQNIAYISGSAQSILMAERVALNFLIHMSGIATLTRHYVLAVQGTNAKITDTRKTLPGLREIQKYAVRAGGGHNHRFGLDDAILIKDNHIAIAGGIMEALDNAKANAGHTVKIEIEVDNLEQLEEVLKHGGADIVMLDNFEIDNLQEAVEMVDGRIITEASGGVSLLNVTEIAETGVDYISVGALTHSAEALDIGLDIHKSV
ncbi:MAG: carboxylating nicotinate-nucleotide diphosphorylase [Alphaproteobacteria bacterium]|nr:carboxylating nicotinate-nucleotide diphosphorylase [Alphaproteobacteria bacterium]